MENKVNVRTVTAAEAVRCTALVKDFGDGQGKVRVLHGIDASVSAGELTLLVGPSGCGKTTLISLVAGLLTPTSGRVHVLGEDLTALSDQALVDRAQTEIDLLCARAPIERVVLRVNVRVGESVPAAPGANVVTLGRPGPPHIRAEFDEVDIARLPLDGEATAVLRGSASAPLALRLVHVEPYVVPKRSLTGGVVERVDTRVLQIVFALATTRDPAALFVGQQVDVRLTPKGEVPTTEITQSNGH